MEAGAESQVGAEPEPEPEPEPETEAEPEAEPEAELEAKKKKETESDLLKALQAGVGLKMSEITRILIHSEFTGARRRRRRPWPANPARPSGRGEVGSVEGSGDAPRARPRPRLGLGRIVALHYHSSTLYQIY